VIDRRVRPRERTLTHLVAFVAFVAAFALTALPVLADPATDAIRNAALKLTTSSSYHVTILADGHTAEGDVAPPDKMKLTLGPVQMIEIAKVTYVNFDGTWHELSMPGAERISAHLEDVRSYARMAPSDIVVTDLGMKTVDGRTDHAYSVNNKGNAKSNILYIDANGYLVRIESNTNEGSGTMLLSKYNQPVTIVAPF
jgi:hypothetical protein